LVEAKVCVLNATPYVIVSKEKKQKEQAKKFFKLANKEFGQGVRFLRIHILCAEFTGALKIPQVLKKS